LVVFWAPFSYLAALAALYVCAAIIFLSQVGGLDLSGRRWAETLVYAFCTGTAVYLLDRVKLLDRFLDPADKAAHPGRYAFLARRLGLVRALVLALLLASMAVGVRVSWFAPVISIGACAGVLVYAGRPRTGRDRIKDRLTLKNAYVAAGITAFSVVLAYFGAYSVNPRRLPPVPADGLHVARLAAAGVYLFARVWADAALCDLDDEAADRDFGTSTLPTWLGRRRAWTTAMGVRLVLAALLLASPMIPWTTRAVWAVVTALSSSTLRLARPRHVRDWVDARFVLEALAVWLVLRMMGQTS
jgi:hypothetical protein